MRQRIPIVLAFVAGTLVGALTVASVAFRALDGAVALLSAAVEQRADDEAGRAWCSGDYKRAAVHGWTELQFAPGIRPHEFDGFPHKPKTLLALSGMAVALTNDPLVDPQTTAYRRARLAVVLERAGLSELANEQWDLASRVFSKVGHKVTRERFAKVNDDRCPTLVRKHSGE